MNIYALITGLVIVTYIIIRFRKTKLDRTKCAYPLLLASFPVYYFAFALYANDYPALGKEVLIGIIFFVIAYIAYRSNRKIAAIIIGSGSFLHALYDAYHDLLFINTGTPAWWLEFCGSIDLILAIYLFYFAINISGTSPALKTNTKHNS